jgi:hypothetical protein
VVRRRTACGATAPSVKWPRHSEVRLVWDCPSVSGIPDFVWGHVTARWRAQRRRWIVRKSRNGSRRPKTGLPGYCDRSGIKVRWKCSVDALLSVRVCFDQAGTDREAFATGIKPSSMQRANTISNRWRKRSLSEQASSRHIDQARRATS